MAEIKKIASATKISLDLFEVLKIICDSALVVDLVTIESDSLLWSELAAADSRLLEPKSNRIFEFFTFSISISN